MSGREQQTIEQVTWHHEPLVIRSPLRIAYPDIVRTVPITSRIAGRSENSDPMSVNKRSDIEWVRGRFDRIAPWYSLFPALFLVPNKARQKALGQLMLKPGDRALCVGCGHGPALPELASGVGSSGAVVGIDLSLPMLKRAQDRLKERGIINAELMHIDLFLHEPPVPYQAIFFEFSWSSFGNPAAALKYCWTLLATGGRIVVVDGRLPPRLAWLTKPLMPAIRWFMEQTVLGDPDMRPMEQLETLRVPVAVEWFRAGTYYVASLHKPF